MKVFARSLFIPRTHALIPPRPVMGGVMGVKGGAMGGAMGGVMGVMGRVKGVKGGNYGTVPLSLIKQLREETRAGYGDCREALEQSGGELTAAVEWLRAKGLRKAAARQRETGEGWIALWRSTDRGAVVHVTAETDFVVRSPSFSRLAARVALAVGGSALPDGPLAEATLRSLSTEGGISVGEAVSVTAGQLGESLHVPRARLLSAPSPAALGSYVHQSQSVEDVRLGKVGTLVVLGGSGAKQEIADRLAFHVTAMNPSGLKKDTKENTKETTEEGKEEEQEVLEDQELFNSDPSQTVGEYLKAHNCHVISFVRMAQGESF